MLLLLLVFDYGVFRRIRYLFINYLDQYDINGLILSKIRNNEEINISDIDQLKNVKIKRNIVSYGMLKAYHYLRYLVASILGDDYELDDIQLKDTSFKIHSVRICTNFISRLIHSWQVEQSKRYFADHFKDFKSLEEDRAFNFEEATNKNAVWIIRLGIFGTLLGITIAFFELYMAMGSLDLAGKGGITETFVTLVQQALLGNGIAIATSLTAHGSTLLLEMGVSFFLRNESNLFWLNNTYDAILNYPRYASSRENPQQITQEIKSSIFDINQGMQTFQVQLGQASPGMQIVNDNMSSLANNLQTINHSFSGITEKMEQFHASAGNYQDYFQIIGNNLKDMTGATEGLVKRLDETEQSMSRVIIQTERFNNLLAALIESLIEISSGSALTMAKSLKNLKKYEVKPK
ncbi:MAG: hypothetical protein ACE5D7_09375, partial [Fidelibacterota bacterium]